MLTIGYASGFLGDDRRALGRMLDHAPDVDCVALDYLAEFNLPILKQQMDEDPSRGYVWKFVQIVDDLFETLVDREVTVVSNAGGMNPDACRRVLLDRAAEAGLDVTVGSVTGDDVFDRLETLRTTTSLENMDTGEAFETVGDAVVSANVYLGAQPIAEALSAGADVVVTGRCTDTALALGPMIDAFGWRPDDYDRLAAGTFAGHLIECGPQVTGGLLLDGWQQVDYREMGYPLVEMEASGEFVVTKPEGTGGVVDERTVAEQMIYEIGDPTAYLQPDVTTDFTAPTVEAVGDDRVAVRGCAGTPPPSTYKAVALYENGYKTQSMLMYSWPDALEKARTAADVIRDRIDRDEDLELAELRSDYLGYDGAHGPMSHEPDDPNEIVLRMAARMSDPDAVRPFWEHVLSVILAGPPNVFPLDDRPPEPERILSIWPFEVPRDAVEPTVTVESSEYTGVV
jgi:hypothetical protein